MRSSVVILYQANAFLSSGYSAYQSKNPPFYEYLSSQKLALAYSSLEQTCFFSYSVLGQSCFISNILQMKEEQNLKKFVSKLIEKRAAQEVPHLYIVDKQTGPYRSIQQAIDDAEPNSLIKISQGFYQQNLIITKPLKLQPKNQSDQPGKIGVVLLVGGGVGVTVKLGQGDQKCEITGMKFSHSGNSENVLRNQLMEHEHILNIFEHADNIDQLEMEFVNRMSPNKLENIGILLQKGKLVISNCMISLNYLVKSCSSTIPAVWVEKEGHLHIVNSEIKGNQNKSTIGVISRLGTVNIQSSTICSHKEGGVVLWGIKGNISKILKSYIEMNSIGISLVGEQFKPRIISNSINKNKIGVKVGLASEPQISRNIIVQNQEGIQINSAFPNISLNKIEKSKGNGIVCRSYRKYLCKAMIRKNVGIAANGLNGILIVGQNNTSSIVNNHMIGFNGQAGIKVQKMAYPTINSNKIYKNYKEGILVVENSNAIIERNEITHNIECNIAIGGINSHHSAVIENSIGESPGVGIYCIGSGRIKIFRNDICRNLDGAILQSGEPELRRNYIAQNKNNGLVCEGESFPLVVQNFITRNAAVGLLFRQKTSKKYNIINSNIVVSNQIDSAIQQYDKAIIKQLNEENTIQTEIYYPESLPCAIM